MTSTRYDDIDYWRVYAGQLENQVRHAIDLARAAGVRHVDALTLISRARISTDELRQTIGAPERPQA